MFDQDLQGELITVDLGDDVIAQVEVIETGREKVGAGTLPFDSIAKAISKISQVIAKPIQEVKPTKATVKYGLAISVEEGSLVAAVVRGTGKANLEITLEWENKPVTNQVNS
ncbi:CU044_2847 family protein [Nostoc sp.]|uniref:CU044_2847 family protein n=1 Tax=Nostoc sp. TaxID=1180 RepID=UPI002FF0E43E